MLYLFGGGGGVAASLNIDRPNISGLMFNHAFFQTLPVTGWKLPPPDGRKYAIGAGYGPRMGRLRIGSIESYNDPRKWHPCRHAHLDGSMFYSGSGGSNKVWCRTVDNLPVYNYFETTQKPPIRLTGKRLCYMKGSPINLVPNVEYQSYDRSGVTTHFTSGGVTYPDGHMWYYQSEFIGRNLHPSYLPAGIDPIDYDQWFITNISYDLIADPSALYTYSYPEKVTWEVLSSNHFRRTTTQELLYSGPYSDQGDTLWSGLGYCKQGVKDVTDVTLHTIHSNNPSSFGVHYSSKSKYTIMSMDRPGSGTYVSTSGSYQTDNTTALMCMHPGNLQTVKLDLSVANNYCYLATGRAMQLFDKKLESKSNSAALANVEDIGSNNLENLAGLSDVNGVFSPLIKGLAYVEQGNIPAAARELASAYLVYKYVFQATWRDAKSAQKSAPNILSRHINAKFSSQRRRGKASATLPCQDGAALTEYFTTYHLLLKQNYVSEVFDALEKLGLQPTPGNLWDIIPYSFVVDWFVNVGGVLKTIDAYNSSIVTRDLKVRINTYKCSWPLSAESISKMFGTAVTSSAKSVSFVWYDRHIHGSFGSFNPLAMSESSDFTLSQMIQGGALITQKL